METDEPVKLVEGMGEVIPPFESKYTTTEEGLKYWRHWGTLWRCKAEDPMYANENAREQIMTLCREDVLSVEDLKKYFAMPFPRECIDNETTRSTRWMFNYGIDHMESLVETLVKDGHLMEATVEDGEGIPKEKEEEN